MIRNLFLFGLVVAQLGFVACTSKKNKVIENQFRFQIESDPPTLDSVLAQEHIGIELIYNLQEGLVKEDKNFNVIPGLAEKWEISPDKKTYTFHLRDSKWSDGVPVKAGDFFFAWQRLLEPKTAATSAYFLFDIENAEAFNAKKVADFAQVGIKVIDDKTLQIKIKNPASYFLHMLTCPTASPQREDIFKAQPKDSYDAPHLRSTGPFRLTEWKHDSKLVLEPNPYYWDVKPQVAKVIYYVVREEATALQMYEQGDLDATAKLPALALDRVKSWPDYHSFPTLRGYYYGFNTQKKPFDNLNVRKAFAHAFNRQEIVKVLKGNRLPSTSWIPKGMLGYEEKRGLDYNPELAKQYLAKAGYPGGKGFPTLTITHDSLEIHKLVAEKIQFMLKTELGLPDVRLVAMEWKVYMDTLMHSTPDFWRMGWGADFPDPHNFMDIFNSKSGQNNTHWKSPAYDKGLNQAIIESDPAKRSQIYAGLQKQLLEDETVIIPLLQESIEMVVKPYIDGFYIDGMEYAHLAGIKVNTAYKAEPKK